MALQSFSCMLLVVGLNRAFSSGVIYCSPITATLLTKDMGMPAERVIPLPVDTPLVIDGVSVTLMDANHCPGACMMLFKVPSKTGKPQVRLPSLCLFHLWLPGCFCILCYSSDSKAYRPYTCIYTYIHLWSHATLCLSFSMSTQAVASCLLTQQTMCMPSTYLVLSVQGLHVAPVFGCEVTAMHCEISIRSLGLTLLKYCR